MLASSSVADTEHLKDHRKQDNRYHVSMLEHAQSHVTFEHGPAHYVTEVQKHVARSEAIARQLAGRTACDPELHDILIAQID